MHGKGIYFANEIGLSWSYGCPNLSNGVGIYILAEVALGNMGPSIGSTANEKNRLEQGYNSTHVDRARPDPKDFTTVFGDVLVPYGKYESSSWSNNNMFIVYNTNQVKLRYIVRIKQKGY